jgi:hypothetical protein
MKRRPTDSKLTDLGAATARTRGGTMGFEDQERTKWLHGFGLADD